MEWREWREWWSGGGDAACHSHLTERAGLSLRVGQLPLDTHNTHTTKQPGERSGLWPGCLAWAVAVACGLAAAGGRFRVFGHLFTLLNVYF